MFKRITIAVFVISLALIGYQAYNFYGEMSLLGSKSTEAVRLFFDNYSQEIVTGNMISLFLLLLCNLTAYKERKAFWVFLPLLFFAMIQVVNAYKGEAIFHFKKSSHFWDGSFSLGLIGACILIALAALVSYINYLILKYVIKKRGA